METNESFVMAAFYAVTGTVIFNSLRYDLKHNLLSSLFLSSGMFFTLYHFSHNNDFGAWFSEYIWAIIALSALIAVVIVMGREKGEFRKSAHDKTAENERANIIVSEGKE